MRLDLFLVEKGYYDSRSKAKAAIEGNAIEVNGKIITKSSYDALDTDIIKIVCDICPYVSRGGLKLEAAIKSFYLDFKDKVIVDIGASTGGFTDCALWFGAKKVYAIDVGTDQLAEKLLNDERVISLEQTNILDIDYFPEEIHYFVMDVSFVSISHVIPQVNKYLTNDNALICLIKPQFEVGKKYMKNGIVKDRTIHIRVLEEVKKCLEGYDLGIAKLIPSPILGGSGNKEFLALVKRGVKSNVNIIEVCNKE